MTDGVGTAPAGLKASECHATLDMHEPFPHPIP